MGARVRAAGSVVGLAPGWARQHHSQRDPPFVPSKRVDVVWGLPRCVWARESTAPAQGNQSLSRELRASALGPGLD